MNAMPDSMNPNSAPHRPGGAPAAPARPSQPDAKPPTVPESLRISGFGFPHVALPRRRSGSVCGFRCSDLPLLLLALGACACLTGCFGFLKPAKATARHFVLTPLPAAEPAKVTPGALAVGVGQVKLPAYLFNTSVAVRKGTNEVEYLPSALWAERLDTGFQRVLAADLAIILPTDRIHLSAWQKDAVAAEVYVTIEQFDVDASGRGVLVARWRILSAGGERILKTGGIRLAHQGQPPDSSASGAIATLSDLVAEFSRQLAQALQEATSIQTAPVSR
jgi:hypothetical protein